jgi:hypothetical protein
MPFFQLKVGTQEGETRMIAIQSQPGQLVHEIISLKQ